MATLAGMVAGGFAGLLLGRFAIGPLLFPVGSPHMDGYEDMAWLAIGVVGAFVAAPLGAVIAYFQARKKTERC
jgi:hypothetical protein